jgi:predicted  nucleic acid-binding Zn-ribbon protein
MATAAQARELLESLDQKVEEFKQAVDALTKTERSISSDEKEIREQPPQPIPDKG